VNEKVFKKLGKAHQWLPRREIKWETPPWAANEIRDDLFENFSKGYQTW